MSETALISVILPVYNAQDYLKESIDSILSQSYAHFEFIIINDGSKDKSDEIIRSYKDPRIRYISQENKGLGATLNVGISLAKGTYIARQDQDDISLPHRFKHQIDFLEKHQEVVLLGTHARIFTDSDQHFGFHKHCSDPALLKFDLLFDNPFVHSSVMFKREIIDAVGNYKSDRDLYEDFDLWSRMSYVKQVANLPEVLVLYRHHNKGLSKNFSNFKEEGLYNQGLKNIHQLLGRTEDAFKDLLAVYHQKPSLYKGSSMAELSEALRTISEKLVQIYPGKKELIQAHQDAYEKCIGYRLNELKKMNNAGIFTRISAKLSNFIHGYTRFVNHRL